MFKIVFGLEIYLGKDYVGLSNESAISYDIGELNPNEEARFSLFIMINDNSKRNLFR